MEQGETMIRWLSATGFTTRSESVSSSRHWLGSGDNTPRQRPAAEQIKVMICTMKGHDECLNIVENKNGVTEVMLKNMMTSVMARVFERHWVLVNVEQHCDSFTRQMKHKQSVLQQRVRDTTNET